MAVKRFLVTIDATTAERRNVTRNDSKVLLGGNLIWLSRIAICFAGFIVAGVFLNLYFALSCLVPAHVLYLPLLWALTSVQLGQLMLLGFWAGMGTHRTVARILIASATCVCLAIWPTRSRLRLSAGRQDGGWRDARLKICLPRLASGTLEDPWTDRRTRAGWFDDSRRKLFEVSYEISVCAR